MPFVTRIGFKPMTPNLEGLCSIQLSYRAGMFRFGLLRTPPESRKGLKKRGGKAETAAKIKKIGEGTKPNWDCAGQKDFYDRLDLPGFARIGAGAQRPGVPFPSVINLYRLPFMK